MTCLEKDSLTPKMLAEMCGVCQFRRSMVEFESFECWAFGLKRKGFATRSWVHGRKLKVSS